MKPLGITRDSRTPQEIGFCHPLRVGAAFVIVLAHVAGGTADAQPAFSGGWWLCKILYTNCLWAVPIFVMVSGMLLLRPQRRESPRDFYVRRLRRLGIPLVFWSVFYLILRFGRSPEPLTTSQVVNAVLSGRPYAHLWFLYMIAGLYLLTPFLRTFIQVTPRSQRVGLIIAGLVLGDAYHLTNVMFWGNSSSIFTLFIPFLSYYLLGYELHATPIRIRPRAVLWAVLAVIAYLVTLGSSFVDLEGQRYGLFFFSFFCPPAVLCAVAIFIAAQHWEPIWPQWLRRGLAALAPTTLGIYIIHVAILEGLQYLDSAHHGPPDLAVTLTAGPLVGFTLSAGLIAVMLKIPLVRRTVG